MKAGSVFSRIAPRHISSHRMASSTLSTTFRNSCSPPSPCLIKPTTAATLAVSRATTSMIPTATYRRVSASVAVATSLSSRACRTLHKTSSRVGSNGRWTLLTLAMSPTRNSSCFIGIAVSARFASPRFWSLRPSMVCRTFMGIGRVTGTIATTTRGKSHSPTRSRFVSRQCRLRQAIRIRCRWARVHLWPAYIRTHSKS
mmetsp:Transcript_54425/g.90168  ORF Transcript_54425/g.90168 Transcript_54425/m.90168 type:complete len:200 (+) Transcript_54425:409-1008(+)